ncbi:sugar phosphate isomerase/epimerase family protein [Streptomyces brevispora]|uniref:Sugar phosphate isomerase/epimerase n=1 Tax=Streptomyces brevispora TaxID=887462 RepID=A0A561V6A1_9ACTN|nr:sugar phosphate isomerase/epimerase [Streptomyces brevispora]TWG07141.1 sugar phosphate isomerase/epimerase [Streptomyces brevispora]WSC12023.1 sugar phosphate isomerase/epimerase [Streptomyces brevispora]
MSHIRKSFDRRDFLRATAGTTVALAAASVTGAAATSAAASSSLSIPKDRIGIQLYSVRDKVSSLGFAVVLAELARIGYQEIEFAGYTQSTSILGRQITLREIRTLLDDNGLRAVGSHVGIGNLRNNLQGELDAAELLGMPHLGTANAPSDTNTVAAYRAAADEFNVWGAAATARGLKLYQHNHSGEFAFATDQPSVRLYDVFLKNTDPRHVYLELDIYWAYVGQYRWPGFDPAAYVRNQPYRYPLFHMKDGDANAASGNGYDIVEFGAGDLPYEKFIRDIGPRASHIGIWEQDTAPNTQPNPPGSLGAADRSFTAIKGLLD